MKQRVYFQNIDIFSTDRPTDRQTAWPTKEGRLKSSIPRAYRTENISWKYEDFESIKSQEKDINDGKFGLDDNGEHWNLLKKSMRDGQN